MGEQRYRRKIALTPDEVDTFLTSERTCRVGTVARGVPHVTPLWFLWHDGAIWLYSLTRSKRWSDIERDGRMSVLVDAGYEFHELHGVEILGTAAPVGEVPRVGEPSAELEEIEKLTADKYFGGHFVYDNRHAWLKVTPDTIRSWDHRKIG